MSDFNNTRWKYDIDSFERCKRILNLAAKVGHTKMVDYATKTIEDIKTRYPHAKLS